MGKLKRLVIKCQMVHSLVKIKKAKIPIADAAHHAIHLQKMKKDVKLGDILDDKYIEMLVENWDKMVELGYGSGAIRITGRKFHRIQQITGLDFHGSEQDRKRKKKKRMERQNKANIKAVAPNKENKSDK